SVSALSVYTGLTSAWPTFGLAVACLRTSVYSARGLGSWRDRTSTAASPTSAVRRRAEPSPSSGSSPAPRSSATLQYVRRYVRWIVADDKGESDGALVKASRNRQPAVMQNPWLKASYDSMNVTLQH